MSDDLTRDAFLGGKLSILQPRKGYRAATDPVFLSAACPARAGEEVLELGCGVGVASLCLAARLPDLAVTGVERQTDYAALARCNAEANSARLEVVEADLSALPPDLRQRSFDHVIANPPYFPPGAGTPAGDRGRETALREDTPLTAWIATARARLKPKGWLTLIQSADRLPDCLTALQDGFGGISVLPLQPRPGKPANRVLIRARKAAKAPFRLLAPFTIHEGGAHDDDSPDYTEAADRILRQADVLHWG